jgi:hypothetical protein
LTANYLISPKSIIQLTDNLKSLYIKTAQKLKGNWNGSLLDSVDAVLNFAQTLTFKDKHPVVTLVEKVYLTGVKLTHLAMEEVEKHLQRLPSLKKWFVEISGKSA